MIREVTLAKRWKREPLKYPLYASPKIDGYRGVVLGGVLRSRALTAYPQPHVAAKFSRPEYEGLDGELVMGAPNAKDVFSKTASAMKNMEGKPDVKFYVFDNVQAKGTYASRLATLKNIGVDVIVVAQVLVNNEAELLAFEAECLSRGFEGVMVREPMMPYIEGRTSAMLKLKRFTDDEAVIIGMEEELSAVGAVRKNRMGALVCRRIKDGLVFNIGTGFDHATRQMFWDNKDRIIAEGWIVKYKYFAIGGYEAPRFPAYVGIRDIWDMSKKDAAKVKPVAKRQRALELGA